MKEIRDLTKEEISCKVKQIGEKGALILLYKTARVDAQILDETFGAANWTNDFKEIKGNLYCGIGVKQEDGSFVWKWDCGTESQTEAEKGEASDSFKRAGFKWGIGVELYTSPFIFASVPTEKNAYGKWELKNKYQKFFVKDIKIEDKKITELTIVDDKGTPVFSNAPEVDKVKKDITNAKRAHTLAVRKGAKELKESLLKRAEGVILRLQKLDKIPQSHEAVAYSNELIKDLKNIAEHSAANAVLEALDKAVMKIDDIQDEIPY